jgi:hypothetical protein
MVSVFPPFSMLAIGVSYIVFIMLRYIASIHSFNRALSWKKVEFYWRLFLHLRWSSGFRLVLLIYCVTFNDLHMLNHPCIPGIKANWLWYMIFLIYCWIWFAIMLLRFLWLYSLLRVACNSLFLLCPCPVWNECSNDFIAWVCQCSFPFLFHGKV